jgi:hypothetical protein
MELLGVCPCMTAVYAIWAVWLTALTTAFSVLEILPFTHKLSGMISSALSVFYSVGQHTVAA